MGHVTYFPRYTTQENVVTNTTLHLFSQINQHSSERLRAFLSDLLGDVEMPLGITFQQQTRSASSVPDGAILQEPVHIVIETKVTAGVDIGQLIRHLESFTKGIRGNHLVLLTKVPIEKKSIESVFQAAKEIGVFFQATTFEHICAKLSGLGKEHEIHLVRITEDYVAYCSEMGLLPDRRKWLRIVPCGVTLNLNARHRVYYQASDRGYSPHSYLGIYNNKAVRMIGEIAAVYDSEASEEEVLNLSLVEGADRAEFRKRIEAMISDSESEIGWDHLRGGHRFFCVETFAPTYFEKRSWGGIQGPRFWDISDMAESSTNLQELADHLRNAHWE